MFVAAWLALLAERASGIQVELCQVGTTGPTLATVGWEIDGVAGTVTVRLTHDLAFSDETYGANVEEGWTVVGTSSNRTFGQLWKSDNATFILSNADGDVVFDFDLDLLEEIPSPNCAPEAFCYESLGVSGGDGSVRVGSPADILSFETSAHVNFNEFGYWPPGPGAPVDIDIDSPNVAGQPGTYTPLSGFENWIFQTYYEITVNLAAFGASGFGEVTIPNLHSSPSKIGINLPPVEPCPHPVNVPAWSRGQVALLGSHPNPFNPTTTIRYTLTETGPTVLRVYNVRGQSVATLVDGIIHSGVHSIAWDGRDDSGNWVASGSYFLRLEAGGEQRSMKLGLLK